MHGELVSWAGCRNLVQLVLWRRVSDGVDAFFFFECPAERDVLRAVL